MGQQKQKWVWPRVVLASHNTHKIAELRALFRHEYGIEVVGLDEVSDLPEVEEDGDTFEANAVKKARVAADALKLPVVADDSGLVVDALDGAPGVYSARYAGAHGDDAANNDKLLRELAGVPVEKRSARFVSVLALVIPERPLIVVRGECPGRIAYAPRGTHGFGYDPLFELEGQSTTMAELTLEEKGKISHRARALAALVQRLREEYVF